MKMWKQYTHLETKRMLKGLPLICLGSLILIAVLAGIFTIFQLNSKNTDENNTVTVAVVAEEEEPFVDWMITAISSIENTKYTLSFQRMDEKTANTSLKSGEIEIAFIIPQNYVASIIDGENKHLTIRFGTSQTTIVSFLLRELSHAASSFILDTEAGIYTMQEYYKLHNLPNQSEDELTLNLQYIKEIVSLDKGIRTEEIEMQAFYPLPQQYLISALVLFLFLWGLTCSQMLTAQNQVFQNQLKLEGVGYAKQVFARSFSFFITALANYLLLFVLASLLMAAFSLSSFGTLFSSIYGLWRFALSEIPVLLLSAVFIQMVYEITGDAMGGVLFLFFSVLIMGLCSGCFYPLSYLPQAIQNIAPTLPIYQACHYGLSVLNGSFPLLSLVYLLACTALCFVLMILCRTVRSNYHK